MQLIIIGPMASGKTTVGRLLSKRLDFEFIDIDEKIEESTGASISWIFDVEGEKKFRVRESEVLAKYIKQQNCVISTGGGIILNKGNRDLLKKADKVIYLETSIQTQLERTLKDNKRPLLVDSNNKEATLREIQKIRNPLYEECANIIIREKENNRSKSFENIISKIKSKLA
ncbi:MAG TPA: shikimate kinase [SAR86 cluster bacterium]|nr:shikimate kinase [SAR86 cluster bacterium]|tara:strand:+ start:9605 stop:10120 length:516 start_codon:yes stop_codon:yes gene_type:complete